MNRNVDVTYVAGLWYVNDHQVSEDTIELIYGMTIDDVATKFFDNIIRIGDDYVCLKCGYMGSGITHSCDGRRYQTFDRFVKNLSTASVRLTYDYGVYIANDNAIDPATMVMLIGYDPHKRWLSQVIVTGKGATRIINVCRACGKIISEYEAKRHIC